MGTVPSMKDELRVAYLLKKFPRLSETFILTEVLTQESLGTRVCILARRPVDSEPRHPELANLKATVEQLPKTSQMEPWSRLCAAPPAGLGGDVWDGLQTCVRDYSSLIGERFPRLLAEALHIRQRAVDLALDHIHVHFATEAAIVAMLSKRLGGPSFSITAHAKDIYRSSVRSELLEQLVLNSQFLVTVCDANVQYLRSMLSPRAGERVRRLYNGLALERFPYNEAGREPAQILAVGRLVEKKGFHVLIDSLVELKRRGCPYKATLVGGGDEADALKQQASEAGLEACDLVFTGPVDQDEIREHMKLATLFVLPCIVGADGNRDALPTVLLEALAMGVPCISTAVTGIPEILDQGRVGRIVHESGPLPLADTIENLLGDSDQRLDMARRGRSRALDLFDAQVVGATLQEWFQESVHAAAEQELPA
ncbi:MAG: colanic acid/amylovoran biosynthesis glycosyltransferase [Candidatus Paceibacteria bacterium]|jgi:colanic acid/amylovoran biosynthesis glycosyltransferase